MILISNEMSEKKLENVREYLRTGNVHDDDAQVRKALKSRAKNYLVYEGMLY